MDWNHGLQDTMIKYFDTLFQSTNTQWEGVISCMSSKITEADNEELLKPIEDTEVKATLFYMHPYKSPGPGGMIPAFYQKFWSIASNDVI